MKISNKANLICSILILGFSIGVFAQDNPKLTVLANSPTVELSPYLYGLFFEDINWGADGGIYAELIQNRSFEYYPVRGEMNTSGYQLNPFTAWERASIDSGSADIVVTRNLPLNSNNLNNLEIRVTTSNGIAGVYNTGFDGIPVNKDEKYNFSLYSRLEIRYWERNQKHAIKIILENETGEILDSFTISSVSNEWTKYSGELSPKASAERAKLGVFVQGPGKYQMDMISLFPENTYKKRPNGLRADLVNSLEKLNPSFLRFPGGCILHGWGIDNVYHWKETLGDVAERKPNWNRWGYHQTYGLGYFEYFQLCEDLGATPLPVVYVGVSCSFTNLQCEPMEDMDAVVQDAVDLVEFAKGPADSEWGKIRAAMGHPEPFDLQYVCLGNEEGDTKEFRERFPAFVKALNETYPEIKLIGTSGLSPNVPLYDLMDSLDVWSSDEHYYMYPEWFIENQDRFDDWDRDKPKVFVGEYASKGNTMYNAVAEAIYLTGIERNADLVEMTCYAPLFARYDHTQWKLADLIWFDHKQVVKTPNYYVQQLFSTNKGNVYLRNRKENWPGKNLAASVTLDQNASEIVIKLANASEQQQNVDIDISRVKEVLPEAKLITLKGAKDAQNTRKNPETVKPIVSSIKAGENMTFEIPPISVQFVRVGVKY